MNNTTLMITGALITAGIVLTYWEIKKNQNLINTVLISLREMRTLSYPNKRNQLNNNINKSSNNNYPHVVVNKKVTHQNNIDQIKDQMDKYQNEIDDIDNLLNDEDEEDVESNTEDVDLDKLRDLADSYENNQDINNDTYFYISREILMERYFFHGRDSTDLPNICLSQTTK